MNKVVTLSQICDELSDGLHKAPEFNPLGEYLFVNANNLEDGFIIDTNDGRRADESEYQKYKIELNENTILYSIDGSIGRIAKYRGEKCILGKGACYLKVGKQANCDYIYYLLQTKEFKEYIKVMSTGSTIHHISLKTMREYTFQLPELVEQRKIVELPKAIDAKIHNNAKVISEIESLLKMMYDYWFFQYDFPNENGEPYKSSGGKMVWNEELKREIPVGWRVGTIETIGDVVGGGTPSTKHTEYYCKEGIGWITPYDLANTTDKYIAHGQRDITEEGIKKSSAKLLPRGTVLMTSRAPIGYLAIASEVVCTNQGFKSIVPKSGFGSEFVYYSILNAIPYIKSLGTGSTFTEVSKEVVSEVKIVVPPKEIHQSFENSILKFSMQIRVLEGERRELSSLRDFLLPLLMNGQIGFRERQ